MRIDVCVTRGHSVATRQHAAARSPVRTALRSVELQPSERIRAAIGDRADSARWLKSTLRKSGTNWRSRGCMLPCCDRMTTVTKTSIRMAIVTSAIAPWPTISQRCELHGADAKAVIWAHNEHVALQSTGVWG